MEQCSARRMETLDPYRGIWRELFLRTDIEFTGNILQQAFTVSPRLARRKATDVAYCIRQAKDYFDSAQVASLVTKPTLIYYGLISLIAVLQIIKSRDAALNTLPATHGMSIREPSGVPMKCGVLQFGATLQKGPLTDLAKLGVADRFTVEWESEHLDWSAKTLKQVYSNNALEGKTISLSHALSCVPEIRSELDIMCVPSITYPGKAYLDRDQSHLWLRFDKTGSVLLGGLTARDLVKEFTALSHYEYVAETQDALFFRSLSSDVVLPRAGTHLSGTTVFFSDSGDNPDLAQLQALHIAFFILGSIARYRPNEWGPLLVGPSSIGLMTETLCETALIKLPLLALSEITDTHITLRRNVP